jgi:hypothetical protein
MPEHAPGQAVLLHALERAGSQDRLATLLGVELEELEALLTGEELVPMRVFLAALDVVLGRGVSER